MAALFERLARRVQLAAARGALAGAGGIGPVRWRIIGQALPFMHPSDDDRIWSQLSARDEIEMEFAERNWGTTAYNDIPADLGRRRTSFDLPQNLDSYIETPNACFMSIRQILRGLNNDVSYEYRVHDNQDLNFGFGHSRRTCVCGNSICPAGGSRQFDGRGVSVSSG